MDRPHILYLIDVLWSLGGAENALLRAVRLLPRDRFRCSIGTFRLRQSLAGLQDLPCPVHEFPLKSVVGWQALQSARRLSEYIRSERVDIVHTFFHTADLWGGIVAKLSGCPILVSSRRDMGILRSPGHRLAYRLLNPMFNQVQAVSEAVRQYTLREERLAPGKVVTIPNGIESGAAPDPAAVDALRERLHLDSGGPIILTVSHVRRVKGIDVTIKALAEVRRSHPDARLLIAGGVNEPAYLQELKAMVESMGLSGSVQFLGKSDEVRELLQLCDVFCLLSRSEGMSNALLEAMAAGVPCVASAVGGTPEVIDDGQTGYLVPVEDAGAAAQRMVGLLDDRGTAGRMGGASQLLVRQRFSAERMMDSLVKNYDGLLDGRMPVQTKRLALT